MSTLADLDLDEQGRIRITNATSVVDTPKLDACIQVLDQTFPQKVEAMRVVAAVHDALDEIRTILKKHCF